ncbi:hypothetical protein BDB01DRAFT_892598 [Pilobolus umbonatus]|nr:hypothetical protein BDB01DRAFT_892598 [Pilobolus umbonatus]
MQHHVIAPCPKKPSPVRSKYINSSSVEMNDVEDACLELQQILQSQSRHFFQHMHTYPHRPVDEHFIARTGNPLIQDSSFIPLHQAVSQLQVSDSVGRPRSYSVDNTRNYYLSQHAPLICSVYD